MQVWEVSRKVTDKEVLRQAIFDLLDADSWLERPQLMEKQAELLLSEKADSILKELSEEHRDDPDLLETLVSLRHLLVRCQDIGIRAAFSALETSPEEGVKALPELLLEWTNTPDWKKSQHYLEAHPEMLSDEAELTLENLVKEAQDDGNLDAVFTYHQHQDLLRKSRDESIEAAYDYLNARLKTFLEAMQIPLPDSSRQIESCRIVLAMIKRPEHPLLWASFQGDLAGSLAKNGLGNRASNIEQAIHHYNLALEVFRRQAFPELSALSQKGLGSVYSKRIDGDLAANNEHATRMYISTILPPMQAG